MARGFMAGMVCLGLMAGLAGSARADTDLELLGKRFRVTAEWRTAAGASGTAQAVPLTDETGLFWFFSEKNVELVVKVLDACAPPYERFWVYASGLTDVEVELTVEDTWTGQSKSYLRPPGNLFAPLADTATFDGCGVPPPQPPCGQGTSAQIAATPLPNVGAEELALLLGSGITADPAIYARLDADLARIQALFPPLVDVFFRPLWYSSRMTVELSPSAYAAAKTGEFHEWDCLNDWYHGEVTSLADGHYYYEARIEFEGRFHPYRIGSDYEALPGVERIFATGLGYPAGYPFNTLCAKIDGTTYDYFFEDQVEQQLWYIRVPQAGAAPVLISHVPSYPDPDWLPLYQQCYLDLAEAAGR